MPGEACLATLARQGCCSDAATRALCSVAGSAAGRQVQSRESMALGNSRLVRSTGPYWCNPRNCLGRGARGSCPRTCKQAESVAQPRSQCRASIVGTPACMLNEASGAIQIAQEPRDLLRRQPGLLHSRLLPCQHGLATRDRIVQVGGGNELGRLENQEVRVP